MMEGRTIDYRPDGGGLDYHNSPLMAEIPLDNYSHIHRSIEHLRSIGVPPPIDHHRHLATNLTDLRRYEHPDEMPEIKPSVLRLSEFKSGLQDIRVHDQENDIQRQMTPHQDDGPKGYSAPSTPLSENGGHSGQEEKVRCFCLLFKRLLRLNINLIMYSSILTFRFTTYVFINTSIGLNKHNISYP